MSSSRASISLLVVGSLLASACVHRGETASKTTETHGQLTELSRVEGEVTLCSHKVPEQVCTRHHPELVAEFKRAGDWCGPHEVPESQCLICHPDLTFDPLPALAESADVAWLSRAGEDVADVASHAVEGKITVVDFYADWCAACRKVTGHVYRRLADEGTKDIAYRKVNVVSWESPVAQRYLADVPSLPLVQIYGRDGKLMKQLHGADLAALDEALAEAGAAGR